MATPTNYTPDEIGDRGEAIYEQSIRQGVEAGNTGKLIMIDIDTGRWVMGEDQIAMARELRQANPLGTRYCLRVGYSAVDSFAGGLRPTSETDQNERASPTP